VIEPLFRSSRLVEFIGEVDERGKDELLGDAYAYLFPIAWPEPFGLTMIEAMATGTPVIATSCGAVPEIVADGETGFVCGSIEEMCEALEHVPALDRGACRGRVERLFSAARMADRYEEVYGRLLAGQPVPLPPPLTFEGAKSRSA
jgi:glycosyltransferase involved in cell wall biosynthesis